MLNIYDDYSWVNIKKFLTNQNIYFQWNSIDRPELHLGVYKYNF